MTYFSFSCCFKISLYLQPSSQWRKVQDRLEVDERCSRLDKIDRLKIFQVAFLCFYSLPCKENSLYHVSGLYKRFGERGGRAAEDTEGKFGLSFSNIIAIASTSDNCSASIIISLVGLSAIEGLRLCFIHYEIQEQLRKAERKNREEFRKLMDEHVATGILTAKTYWRDYYMEV